MPHRPRPSKPSAAPALPRRPALPALTLAVKYALWEGSIKPASAHVQPKAAPESAPAPPAPAPPAIAALAPPAPPVTAPAPDEQMYCTRRALACSASFCDSEHRRAQAPKPDPWTARWHCYRCPDHAQRVMGDAPPAWESRCVRCNELTNRLILGVYFASCYNRGREYVINENARGAAPIYVPRLARYRVAAIYPPAERITWVETTAAHWIEAMRVAVAIAARAGVRVWIIPKLSERIGRPTTIRPAITAGPAIASSELPPSAHRPPPAPLAVSAVVSPRSAATPVRC